MTFRLPMKFFTELAHRMVGVQSYDHYVQRMKANSPSTPVMSREEYFHERQKARYCRPGGGKGGCC
ncbi:YbdD/YjiX family protein [Salmonella enterica]|nr:YbdD/YjiX family protein [Salmonella enterica]